MEHKLILTDCDGVLLDWQFGFDQWMSRHGYIKVDPNVYGVHLQYGLEKPESRKLTRMFNESAAIGWLPPFKDAVYYVDLLRRKHGYVFDVITSQTLEPAAQELRIANLKRHFGDAPFNKFTILDTGQDKNKALIKYKDSNCFWVEDKPENAEVGYKYGLIPILIEHPHSDHYDNDNVWFAKTWEDVYNIVIGEETKEEVKVWTK